MKPFRIFSFLLAFFTYDQNVFACECKGISPLTIVECRRFDAILKCEVDSVTICEGEKSIGYAHVLEIYKGDLQQQISFCFDCTSACLMSFAKNETWLLYGKWNQSNQLDLNFCDRNRKYFSSSDDDYYTTNTGLSFENEINYLKKNIGFKNISSKAESESIDITQRENKDTSGANKLLLLGVSLLLFLLMYFVVNKIFK